MSRVVVSEFGFFVVVVVVSYCTSFGAEFDVAATIEIENASPHTRARANRLFSPGLCECTFGYLIGFYTVSSDYSVRRCADFGPATATATFAPVQAE